MQKEIVLRAAQHGVEARHGAAHHAREIGEIVFRDAQEIALMLQRENVYLPLVAAGEGFDGDKLLAVLDPACALISRDSRSGVVAAKALSLPE